MPFSIAPGEIPGLFIIEPRVFSDERGFFMESYKASDFSAAGIPDVFVQDNQSCSSKGVLRGLHFQSAPHTQSKLVRVIKGSVWDVAVDLRKDSPTFGKWTAVILSEKNRRMFYMPAGFAHGFLSLEDNTEFLYKCGAEYDAGSDGGIRYDDPDINIKWPDIGMQPLVSDKDKKLPRLSEIKNTVCI